MRYGRAICRLIPTEKASAQSTADREVETFVMFRSNDAALLG